VARSQRGRVRVVHAVCPAHPQPGPEERPWDPDGVASRVRLPAAIRCAPA